MPSIVAHELYYGAYRSQHVDDNLRRVEALRLELLDFDREDGPPRRAVARPPDRAGHAALTTS
ncbi:MAG: hypothetical protein LBF93_09895 [Zoogloeaceae bacterium]|nr:hypothetical protein [Zoogloeaceae bacterium]